MKTFKGNFTQQEPISEEGIEAALNVLRSGRLHRYNLNPDEIGEVGLLEQEFAASIGSRYCLAVASGGYALATALRAVEVRSGEQILTNAFTLAPVPGAIASVGGIPVYVGVTEDLVIDLDHLKELAQTEKYRILVLSHMRGHICDMDRLMSICNEYGLIVVQDCAHTMGAKWKEVCSGRHGRIGYYSTQTYKHMNSGEGGFLVSDDPDLMARAIMLSGSYMLYARHGAAPDASVFEKVKYTTPNVSGRMDHLRAAILRPQLARLNANCKAWNERYLRLEERLSGVQGVTLIRRPKEEHYVASSFQFLLLDWSDADIEAVVNHCAARGVELKWFGQKEPKGFTSRYDSWKYAPVERLPATDRVLKSIMDMRIPLTFSLEDCDQIADIIRDVVSSVCTH